MFIKQAISFFLSVMCFAYMSGQTIPPNVPQNGLVAWYPFNGNANDESVNNNHGTNFGASLTTDRFGNPNSAYYFDGQTSFIEVPDPNAFVFNSSTSFTINLWFRPDSLDPALNNITGQVLIQKYSCPYVSTMDHVEMKLSDVIHALNRGTSHNAQTTAPVDVCKDWNMVTYIKDAANDSLMIYVDGILESQIQIPSFGHTTDVTFRFGAERWCTTPPNNLTPIRHYKGKIDDAGIWDRKLTQAEISNLYDYSTRNIELSSNADDICPGDSFWVTYTSSVQDSNVHWQVTTPSSGFTINADTVFISSAEEGSYLFELYIDSMLCKDTSFVIDTIGCTECSVGDFPFQNNALDMSGLDHHGVPIGAPTLTTGRCGSPDSAYLFDGQSDYIEINNNQPVITSGEFSVIVMAQKLGQGGGIDNMNPLFQQRDDKVQTQTQSKINFFAENFSGLINVNIRRSGNTSDAQVTSPAPQDTLWHCYAAGVDSTDTLRLFLDGVELGNTFVNQTGDYTTSIDHVQFGRNSYNVNPNRGYFNGKMERAYINDCYVDPVEVCKNWLCDKFNPKVNADSGAIPGCESALAQVIGLDCGTAPYSFSWSNGDSVQQTLLDTGNHYVMITDSNGCTAADSFYIARDSVIVHLPDPDSLCFGDIAIVYYDASDSFQINWQISAPDSTFTGGNDTIEIPSIVSGIYEVALTYSSDTCSFTVTDIFVVDSFPDFTILPDDSIYCAGDTLSTDTLPGYNYEWNTGSERNFTSVDSSGTYAVTVTSPEGCIYRDSLRADSVIRVELNLPEIGVLCEDDTLTLNIPEYFDSVIWSDGDSSFSKQVWSSDTLWASGENACGTFTDTAIVQLIEPLDSFNLNDTLICEGEVYEVELPAEGADSIIWSDGSSLALRSLSEPKTYRVEVINICEVQTGEFELMVIDTPEVFLDSSYEMCDERDSAVVELSGNDFNYVWSTGDSGSSLVLRDSGRYFVTVSEENGCSSVYPFTVEICPFEVIIPNVFTPNGDGVNDQFIIKGLRGRKFNFNIYNRWGILLFDNQGFIDAWDGTTNGKEVPAGAYFYIVEFTNEITGKQEVKKGSLQLLKD